MSDPATQTPTEEERFRAALKKMVMPKAEILRLEAEAKARRDAQREEKRKTEK